MSVLVCVSGCGLIDKGIKKAGSVAGTKIGTTVARKAPPPKTTVVVEGKGGNFCDTMGKLGWPIRPNESDVDHVVALSPSVRTPVLGTQEWGERKCDWKP